MSSQPSRDLEIFPNPKPGRDYTIRIRIPEFHPHSGVHLSVSENRSAGFCDTVPDLYPGADVR
jgi:hypothetical protein